MGSKLTKRVKQAIRKARRIASLIEVAQRRVDHFDRRYHHYKRGENERGATRARRRLGLWRRRRNALTRQLARWHDIIKRRRRQKKRWLKKHPQKPTQTSGVGTIDGKQVAAWMIPWIQKARAHGWRGVVVSGWRDPAYSEQLCYGMCGAPSCPGRCAGRSSNHAGSSHPAGAIDVSDYYTFGRVQREIGSPLINRLGAADPVHFSISGN